MIGSDSQRARSVAALLGDVPGSPLDERFTLTTFRDMYARKKRERALSLRELGDLIYDTEAADKTASPVLKFQRFGDKATEKGAIRNNANVLDVTGAEIDYDDGAISLDEAEAAIRKTGCTALLYTSSSHTAENPRWRALFPFSRTRSTDERTAEIEKLNAVFGGAIDQQTSFTLSQAMFFGSIEGRPAPQVRLIEGRRWLDEADDLPRLAKGARAAADGGGEFVDESRSGRFFRACMDACRAGQAYEDFLEEIDDELAGYAEEPRADSTKGQHDWARAEAKVAAEHAELASRFSVLEDEPEQSDSFFITLAPAALNENLQILDKAFARKTRLNLFQRSGRVVFIRNEIEGLRNGKEVVTPHILEMTPPQIQQAAMSAASFRRFDERKKKLVNTECPEKFAAHYRAMTEWSVPHLHGILSAPTLRADGSILSRPGYDRETGIFLAPNSPFPTLPLNPSLADAERAVATLRSSTRGFDFVDDAAFGVWVACLLTVLLRPSLPTAPMFGIDAPMAGSGKTKLATGVSLIARGETVAVGNQAPTPEEEEKRLFSALRAGRQIVIIDNAVRPLDGEHLCAVTTSPRWSGRILGQSVEQAFPTAITIIATGNGLVFSGDLASRAFVCRLEPQVENPRERKFDFVFEDELLARRGELVVAALTIARYGIVTGGSSAGPGVRFPEWDRLVRHPLMAAGLPDIISTMHEADDRAASDPHLVSLLDAWFDLFGAVPVRLKRIEPMARDAGSKGARLLAVMAEIAPASFGGGFDAERFGKWLRGNKGKFGEGHVLRGSPDPNGNGARWHVERSGLTARPT